MSGVFLNIKMSEKLYFCDELNNTLALFHEGIRTCCSGHNGPFYFTPYQNEKIIKEDFLNYKKSFFSLLTEENISKSKCQNCFFLREKKQTDTISDKYKMLHISHWTHCNCGCIYCARMQNSKGIITTKKQKSEYYDILPVIKQLYKQELLDKDNLEVCVQGGDISVLKEFEPMIKEFLKKGIKSFNILSNNIVYQPIIRKLLELRKANFMTSLDCGCAETYRKLKRVDKFDDCIKNIKKYAKGFDYPPICIKYIVVEHINDNIEEIDKFINLVSSLGITSVEFMIDNKWSLFTDLEKTPFPKHYIELYEFFKKSCKEKNINLTIWNKLESDLQKQSQTKYCL